MKKSEFLEEVAKEARAIKKHASLEQRMQLNFEKLNPNSPGDCIYGQMLGSCESKRAKKLIDKCCTRMFDHIDQERASPMDLIEGNNFSSFKKAINGEYDENVFWDFRYYLSRDYRYLSMVEGYIAMKGAKNQNLIDFLQEKREDLVL